MTPDAIAPSDQDRANSAFSLCRIFETMATAYAYADETLPVLHGMLETVQHSVDAGKDLNVLVVETIFNHPDFSGYTPITTENMTRIGLHPHDVARADAFYRQCVFGRDEKDVPADSLRMLQVSDVFAGSYARTYGDDLTATLIPAALKTQQYQVFFDNYGLYDLKRLSSPAP